MKISQHVGDLGTAAAIALVDAQQRDVEERRFGPARWSEAASDLVSGLVSDSARDGVGLTAGREGAPGKRRADRAVV